MEPHDIQHKVLEILSSILLVPMDDLDQHSSPQTIPNWDSLKHMNLVMAIEEEFEVQFTPDEFLELLSVPAILETLSQKLTP